MDISSIYKTYPFTGIPFQQHLVILGFALIAASFLYLIAANWFMLPPIVQLGIPQCLLIFSSLGSYLSSSKHSLLRQSFDTVSGLMLGLSLAVIGQIYQTGADSYVLFSVWSVLLLPWLYQRNVGIFVLFSIVSLLAIKLAFSQTILSQYLYLDLGIISLWIMLLLAFSLFYTPNLRFLFLGYFALHTIYILISYFSTKDTIPLWFCFISLILMCSYFYTKKDQLMVTLGALILGSSISFLMIENLLHDGVEIFSSLFILAVIILAWFAGISFFLKTLFPNSRFNMIPLAFGAWLAGLFFASIMLLFWGEMSLIAGVLFMLAGIFLLKNQNLSLFVRQLAYCLFISGQIAFLTHLTIELERIWPAFILQILITVALFYLRSHWFFWFLQLLAMYILGTATIIFYGEHHYSYTVSGTSLQIWFFHLLNYGFFSLLLILPLIEQHFRRSILMMTVAVLVVSAFSRQFFGFFPENRQVYSASVLSIVPIIFFVAFILLYLKPQFKTSMLLAFSVLATLLIYFGYFEILLLFMILSWALAYKDRLVYAMGLLGLSVVLWHLYYNLHISFLQKSLSIFISGLIVLLLAYFIFRTTINQEHKV